MESKVDIKHDTKHYAVTNPYMDVRAKPIFQKGHLLKRSMLEAISDQAYLGMQLLFKGYADGILSGCEVSVKNSNLIIAEGIVIYQEKPMFIKESMVISYEPTNQDTYVRFCFHGIRKEADVQYQEMELVLTNEEKIGNNELELCRFKLQEGAVLRYQYQDFEDRLTEYDTVQTIYSPYAAYGNATISRAIVVDFAREMFEQESISELDSSFCIQILTYEQPIAKEAILHYLKRVHKIHLSEPSNLNIYNSLVHVLRRAKGVETLEQKGGKGKLMVE